MTGELVVFVDKQNHTIAKRPGKHEKYQKNCVAYQGLSDFIFNEVIPKGNIVWWTAGIYDTRCVVIHAQDINESTCNALLITSLLLSAGRSDVQSVSLFPLVLRTVVFRYLAYLVFQNEILYMYYCTWLFWKKRLWTVEVFKYVL